jgi:hypothetical protein
MDEVFIAREEDDYYTDGTTTGDSENDSVIILMHLRRMVQGISSSSSEILGCGKSRMQNFAKSFVTKRDSLKMCSFVPAGSDEP